MKYRITVPDDWELQPIDTMPKMPEEAREQCRLVAALRRHWKDLPTSERPIVFAIPNGGQRDAREGANLKAQGVLAGIPDVQIVLPCGKVLWLEMKAHDGRLSPVQRTLHADLVDLGHRVRTAYSAEDGLRCIVEMVGSP